MKVNLTPILLLLAGWCFFDREGLGAVAVALVAVAMILGGDENEQQ